MGFVNDKAPQPITIVQLLQLVAQLGGFVYLFGCDQQQTDSGTGIADQIPPTGVFRHANARGQAERGRVTPGNGIKLRLLVVNEGYQGRHHQGNLAVVVVVHEGGELIGQTLATARAHDAKDVVSANRRVYNGFLLVSKGGEAKGIAEETTDLRPPRRRRRSHGECAAGI